MASASIATVTASAALFICFPRSVRGIRCPEEPHLDVSKDGGRVDRAQGVLLGYGGEDICYAAGERLSILLSN